MKIAVKTSLIIVFAWMGVRSACAWGEISHMRIENAAGVTSLGELPDAWNNMTGLDISKDFCWTHAVQMTGHNFYGSPNVPTNRDDREPGKIMLYLFKNKLSTPAGDAEATAKSFMFHNAADRVVHYSYFLGGTKDNWLVQHKGKEMWADYLIYIVKFGGGFNAVTNTLGFKSGGDPTKTLAEIGFRCSGDPKTIRLSQQIYIKNRWSTEAGSTDGVANGLGSAESMAAIAEHFAGHKKESENEFQAMRVWRFERLVRLARSEEWSDENNNAPDLWDLFNKATNAVAAAAASN